MSNKITPVYLDTHLTLGADPEFLCFSKGGSVQSASAIIGTKYDSKFGVDGGGTAFELRPEPSTDPDKVVQSIQKSIQNGMKAHPSLAKLNWRGGGSIHNPIGGHIHFGTASLHLPNFDAGLLAKHLDMFLAIPVLSVEKKEEAIARRDTGYGGLSDMRCQAWGCEYRTCGSWVTSPAIALAVLSLAKVVACESLSGLILVSDYFTINGQQFARYTLPASVTEKSWARIERMELFPKYKKNIEIMKELAKRGQTWHVGDMKDAWNALTPKMIARIKKAQARAAEAPEHATKLSDIWKGLRSNHYTVKRLAATTVSTEVEVEPS
jgi:hypothetical protein